MGEVISAGEAERQAKMARQERKVLVFTNGCFDLLHVGHVRFLSRCRKEGDLLFVGVNSDESIKSMEKGVFSPVNCEMDRLEVVAALASVSYAMLFREPTPLELIEILCPDVLCKDSDWGPLGVVGREFVEERGGRVVLIPRQGGWSTTQTAARIARQLKEHV